jgi:transcriptional regulator with XRE-family HTH domain
MRANGQRTRRTITDEWRQQVREALREQGLRQSELANLIGTTRASVSLLLSGKVESSRQVEPISELLDIELPSLSASYDSSHYKIELAQRTMADA